MWALAHCRVTDRLERNRVRISGIVSRAAGLWEAMVARRFTLLSGLHCCNSFSPQHLCVPIPITMSITLDNIYAPTPVVTRGQPFHLGGDPKGKNFLYCCGSTVVIRDIENPLLCDIYAEHSANVTCAKYSPSGFYICSGDSSGIVRIWDTTQKEHPLKIELKVLSGAICDIAWSADSQRIVAVGEGKEQFGTAFFWDTGASVGTISGHSKTILSCDIKPNRPFRLVTSGLDATSCFFEGPPFKFKRSVKDHSRFANCVRFSPDGSKYISVGSDMKGFLYDAKTSEKIGELSTTDAHKGGIYSVSWSPDGTQILTASADRTAKIWDATSFECKTTFTFADKPGVEHQQYACLWQGQHLITVSLSGDINYLDVNNPAQPLRVVRGHNKFISAMDYDSEKNAIYSGSYDGVIRGWDVGIGPQSSSFVGKGHTNQIQEMHVRSADQLLVTAAMDDTFRTIPLESKVFEEGTVGTFEDQPVGLAIAPSQHGLSVAVTLSGVVVLRDGHVASTLKTAFRPTCVALSPDETEVAVGGEDKLIHIMALDADILEEKKVLEKHRGMLTAVQYSPNGELIASADANREVLVWSRDNMKVKIEGWVFHNARVTCLSWSPDSLHVVTGALDQQIIVWSVSTPSKRVVMKNAHYGGVTAIVFVTNTVVASAGQDCCVKTWGLAF